MMRLAIEIEMLLAQCFNAKARTQLRKQIIQVIKKREDATLARINALVDNRVPLGENYDTLKQEFFELGLQLEKDYE